MATREHALQELYQAPIADFLAERKRLAADLRAKHDAAAAAEISKRRKPTASVWVVNQLYWQARDDFADALAAAARLRKGDVGAGKAYRDGLARLRKRATVILEEAGLGASDTTLRRVSTTLAAIAASGGFDPDPAGALAADRDAPGFEVIGIPAEASEDEPRTPPTLSRARDGERHDEVRERARADRARARAAEEEERKRREAEQARRKAERTRLQEALRAAATEVRAREREHGSLEKQLQAAGEAVRDARDAVKDLERKLREV